MSFKLRLCELFENKIYWIRIRILKIFLTISKCLLAAFYSLPFIRLKCGLDLSAQIEIFNFDLLKYDLVTHLKSEVRKHHSQNVIHFKVKHKTNMNQVGPSDAFIVFY